MTKTIEKARASVANTSVKPIAPYTITGTLKTTIKKTSCRFPTPRNQNISPAEIKIV
jgi:hypothetical protein